MRVAVIVNSFPSISETFIFYQVIGAVAAGNEIDIFARSPVKVSLEHPLVEKCGLLDKIEYFDLRPRNKIARAVKAVPLVLQTARRSPGPALRSLNPIAFGISSVNLELPYAAAAFCGKGSYDVIHAHYGHNGLLAVMLNRAKAVSAPVITEFLGYDLSRELIEKGDDVYKALFQDGALFMTVCQYFADRLKRIGCPPQKIVVHRSGIDLSRFEFRPRKPKEGRSVKFFSVCRLVEKKGVEFMIRAVAAAAAKRPDLEISYDVVGHGELHRQLDDLIGGLGARRQVRLLGPKPLDEVARLEADSHVFMQASVRASSGDEEGIPNSIMEAMASGMPVIATRHSGIPELVEDGVTGILVPERDVDALERAILEIVDNPQRWPQMGKKGREKVMAEHDSAKLNERLLEIYKSTAENYKAAQKPR